MGKPAWTRKASGIFTLARTTEPTDSDWVELIEARVALIMPHLDSFTLSRMIEVKCLHSEHHMHDLRGNKPSTTTGDDSFSLEDQGVFDFSYRSRRILEGSGFRTPYLGGINCPSGSLYIWGLTRKNPRWVLANLTWIGTAGYKDRGYEKANRIHFQEATLLEIVTLSKVTYEEIWQKLGLVIRQWRVDRKRLYSLARDMELVVEAEELALSAVRDNLIPHSAHWFCSACETRGMVFRKPRESLPNAEDRDIRQAHRSISAICSGDKIRVMVSLNELSEEEREMVLSYSEKSVNIS